MYSRISYLCEIKKERFKHVKIIDNIINGLFAVKSKISSCVVEKGIFKHVRDIINGELNYALNNSKFRGDF